MSRIWKYPGIRAIQFGQLQYDIAKTFKGTASMKRLFNWLASKVSPRKPVPSTNLRRTGSHPPLRSGPAAPGKPRKTPALPARQPEFVDLDPHFHGRVDELGPGKNVLTRNKFVREDTGTHDTLKILDDSMIESDEEAGIDPYNTGRFDRSKNWDKRFRN
jgi:hypothetical protein